MLGHIRSTLHRSCRTPLPLHASPAPMQEATGYRLEVATVRRLEFENDTFAFGDKLIKKWYSGEQRVSIPLAAAARPPGPHCTSHA